MKIRKSRHAPADAIHAQQDAIIRTFTQSQLGALGGGMPTKKFALKKLIPKTKSILKKPILIKKASLPKMKP